jgi:uncharacterized damage-inducible protein DinB
MSQLQESKIHQLQRPGAGVPWYQRLIFRYFVAPFVAGRTDWVVSEQNFHKINGRILKEIESLSEKQLTTKVLIPPITGLEDSSRFWSISMTLEHLLIVSELMMSAIIQLTSGSIPQSKVSTADVKPTGKIKTEEVIHEFKLMVSDDYKKFYLNLQDKKSELRFEHPWFGPLTAKQWFWVLTIHHGVHLKQIREIKKRLSLV